uniref:Uncharacterized protein n=1 Tax=Trichobilharzia regenti TaxID=157069 RepID=A0AA85J5Y4_TRIRE|nr:unnamed protein product [Trichobilharzia regenti]
MSISLWQYCYVEISMETVSQVGIMSTNRWQQYATIACMVLIVILCIILFLKFSNNIKVALVLTGIIIVLFSANIFIVCCENPGSECFTLLGFILLEVLLTIIFSILTRRFKRAVNIVMMSLSAAFLITGFALYFVKLGDNFWMQLAGCFWNSALVVVLLAFASSLK